jgi:hypothetical protein
LGVAPFVCKQATGSCAFATGNERVWRVGTSDAIHAVEAWVRDELRSYALALRKLAYTLPNGAGEHDLLELSDQMKAAGRELAGILGAVGPKEPAQSHSLHEQESPTIDEIRGVIPDWPDTNGIPWQMCAPCRLVYDPTCFHPHGHCRHDEQRSRR